MELWRLKESCVLDFEILASSPNSALIECSQEIAKSLATRSGGIFKVCRVCGSAVQELRDCLPLPDDSKFNWTVSTYHCSSDVLEDTKIAVSDLLKSSSLGKSRFLRPETSEDNAELKVATLIKNVLTGDKGRTKGLDVIVDCTLGNALYGYTAFASDVDGFQERDFGRPYQDPTVTMGPRLARTLVNLCGLSRGKTILDPFCGLGTILQEALMLGCNVVGVEISSSEVARCRENLGWLMKRFQLSSKLSSIVIRRDTMGIESSDLPRIDAIATEPILIPKLERNPTAERSVEIIRGVSGKYTEAFRAFSRVLDHGSAVSIVIPDLIDDRGKSHGIDVVNLAGDLGFVAVHPMGARIENPCPVPTAKRKIIRRKIYLMKKRQRGA